MRASRAASSTPGRAAAGRPAVPPWWARVLLALWVLAGSAAAQAPAGDVPAHAPADLPLEEIVPGDVGYGLTEGPVGIERFDVEVLARQEASGPGFPTLLVRTGGPFLEGSGGVAAGMSGSPVYLGPPGEERLAGALAYAFPGGDHRLALVTPIAAMRALTDEDGGAPDPPGGAAPLAAPLLVSGVDARALGHLAPGFERVGHRAVRSRAAPEDRSTPKVRWRRGRRSRSRWHRATSRSRRSAPSPTCGARSCCCSATRCCGADRSTMPSCAQM